MKPIINREFDQLATLSASVELNSHMNVEKKFNSNLDIDYNIEVNDARLESTKERDTVLSWENINVYTKSRKKFLDLFRSKNRSDNRLLNTQSGTNVKINHSSIEKYLVDSKSSLETISNGSFNSSESSSFEASNQKYRQILNQGCFCLLLKS